MKLILTFNVEDLDDPTHVGDWIANHKEAIEAFKETAKRFDGYMLVKSEVTR